MSTGGLGEMGLPDPACQAWDGADIVCPGRLAWVNCDRSSHDIGVRISICETEQNRVSNWLRGREEKLWKRRNEL